MAHTGIKTTTLVLSGPCFSPLWLSLSQHDKDGINAHSCFRANSVQGTDVLLPHLTLVCTVKTSQGLGFQNANSHEPQLDLRQIIHLHTREYVCNTQALPSGGWSFVVPHP